MPTGQPGTWTLHAVRGVKGVTARPTRQWIVTDTTTGLSRSWYRLGQPTFEDASSRRDLWILADDGTDTFVKVAMSLGTCNELSTDIC